MKRITLKPVLLAVLSAYATQVYAESKSLDLGKVEMIDVTPLKGVGQPLDKIPAGVQVVKEQDLVEQKNLNIADFINQNLVGVNVNEVQNNPFQPNVNFHGFTASPLLGTPQGLSVFVDGVRVNEPFGDVVNWDLIPMNAIQGMSLIPGSNPLFGLNTLGGALSVQTKSGRTNQGGAVEAYAGAWGRRAISAEYGAVSTDGAKDFFISGNTFTEDGWRDFSPTDVNQVFAKTGWQNEKTAINVSLTFADNKLVGNGLIPRGFVDGLGYRSILTRPDTTENKMAFINTNWSHYFSDDVQWSGNVFYRVARTKTLNGDANDDYDASLVDLNSDGDIDAAELASANADCQSGIGSIDPDEACSGALNRSSSRRTGYGLTTQLTFTQDVFGLKNQFISGMGYDYGKTRFRQTTEYGLINATRGVDGTGSTEQDVDLSGISKTWSIFATDTMSLNPFWHLTASARYNTTKVENSDKLLPSGPGSLSGNHTFNRLNPAVGINYTPVKEFTAYASYNEGSRAPTAIELGCADPNNPCKLPNAMAGDPPLNQVVTKTFEGGFRGRITPVVNWSLGAYRSENHDDIQFIAAGTTGSGYFNNVGKTKREGLDAGFSGVLDKFSWSLGYSFVRATYESSFDIANEVNTSNSGGIIHVKSGDTIPGIPEHQLKLRLGYYINPAWNIGSNILAFSDQYAHGNENNEDSSSNAKVKGYAIVNLDTRYQFSNGWQLFARVNNLFDRRYYSSAMLGEHRFNTTTGLFTGNESTDGFYAPGAPRAGWIGVRYEFGGKKSASNIDSD